MRAPSPLPFAIPGRARSAVGVLELGREDTRTLRREEGDCGMMPGASELAGCGPLIGVRIYCFHKLSASRPNPGVGNAESDMPRSLSCC